MSIRDRNFKALFRNFMPETSHLNPMFFGRGVEWQLMQEFDQLLLFVLIANTAHQFCQNDRRKNDASFF